MQVRQGFRHRRENCQRNDRCVVHDSPGAAANSRCVEAASALEQRIRTSGDRIHAPRCAPAAGAHGGIDRFASRIVRPPGDADGEVDHVTSSVRRLDRKELRMDIDRRRNAAAHRATSSHERTALHARARRRRARAHARGRASPRRTHRAAACTLERRSAAGRAKTMAANVDLLVAVTALADPPPRLVTLDQLLAFAELEEIAAAVVFTKPDLAEPHRSSELFEVYSACATRRSASTPRSASESTSFANCCAAVTPCSSETPASERATIFRALGRGRGRRRGLAPRARASDHDVGAPLPPRRRLLDR